MSNACQSALPNQNPATGITNRASAHSRLTEKSAYGIKEEKGADFRTLPTQQIKATIKEHFLS